jgi:hypothetical protein
MNASDDIRLFRRARPLRKQKFGGTVNSYHIPECVVYEFDIIEKVWRETAFPAEVLANVVEPDYQIMKLRRKVGQSPRNRI